MPLMSVKEQEQLNRVGNDSILIRYVEMTSVKSFKQKVQFHERIVGNDDD